MTMPESKLKDTTVGAIIVGVLITVLSTVIVNQISKRVDTTSQVKPPTSGAGAPAPAETSPGQNPEQPKPKCIAVGMAFDESMTAGANVRSLSELPLQLTKALQNEGACASVVPTAMAVEGFHLASKPVSGDEGRPLIGFDYAVLITTKLMGTAPLQAVGELDGMKTNIGQENVDLEISCYRLPSAELIDIVHESFSFESKAAISRGTAAGETSNLPPESFQKVAKKILPLISQ
jgi:hypothetical protein